MLPEKSEDFAFGKHRYACTSTVLRRMKRILYVYSGEGADERARDQLFLSLTEAACPQRHKVSYITPPDIIKGQWVRDAALLAIGGGYDLGLIRALGDDGIGVIRNYVGDGGNYLGVCSGGYFACDHIEFDKNGPLQVCGERHLKFFPGLCIGPVFPGFQYQTFEGAVATPIEFWDADLQKVITFRSYFNGGGHFQPYKHAMNITKDLIKNQPHPEAISSLTNGIDESQITNGGTKGGNSSTAGSFCASKVEILSKYSAVEGNPLAVVKTKFGHGVAVLAGTHIEYNVEGLPQGDVYVNKMIRDLRKGEATRRQCFLSILKQLNISCKDSSIHASL